MLAPCRSPGMLLQNATTLLGTVMRQGPGVVYAWRVIVWHSIWYMYTTG